MKNKKQIKKKKKTRTFLRVMPQWKEHRPSILRPKFAKNLELGFLFCLVLFCLNQTTTSFKSFTRSNYSVPKHQTCTAHGPHGKAPRLAKLAAERAEIETGLAAGSMPGAQIAEAGRRLNHVAAEVAMLEERWLELH